MRISAILSWFPLGLVSGVERAFFTAEAGSHALSQDDECLADGRLSNNHCSFSALQTRKVTKSSVTIIPAAVLAGDDMGSSTNADVLADESLNDPTAVVEEQSPGDAAEAGQVTWACRSCMQNNGLRDDSSAPAPENLGAGLDQDAPDERWLGTTPVLHYALPCQSECGNTGFCESYCGAGNACCYMYDTNPPPECKRIGFYSIAHTATCVSVLGKVPTTTTTEPGPLPGPSEHVGIYRPRVQALLSPSSAPLLEFYMYRVASTANYPFENVNAGNLPGIMWYLHNEVVSQTPRKFGITRILRLKMKYRATDALLAKGMSFGVRYAYDSGRCTGPWDCDNMYDKYGYILGCNRVNDFPTKQWSGKNHYENAIWYSLPGPCNNRVFNEHDLYCRQLFPGGACHGEPSGRGDCTYSYEPAGEIHVNDLEGIKDYEWFIRVGGKEYSHNSDRGSGLSFWDGMSNPEACARRVNTARDLFRQKYPGSPDLADVPCDFNFAKFYAGEGYAHQ